MYVQTLSRTIVGSFGCANILEHIVSDERGICGCPKHGNVLVFITTTTTIVFSGTRRHFGWFKFRFVVFLVPKTRFTRMMLLSESKSQNKPACAMAALFTTFIRLLLTLGISTFKLK